MKFLYGPGDALPADGINAILVLALGSHLDLFADHECRTLFVRKADDRCWWVLERGVAPETEDDVILLKRTEKGPSPCTSARSFLDGAALAAALRDIPEGLDQLNESCVWLGALALHPQLGYLRPPIRTLTRLARGPVGSVAVAEVLHSLEVVESGLCPDRTAGSGDGLLELLERFRDVHAFLSKGPVIVPYDRPWRDRVRESGWDALPVGANGSLNPPSPAAGDTYHLRRVKE